jgi:hypothetical protein
MRRVLFVITLFMILAGFLTKRNFYTNKMQSFKWIAGSWTTNVKRGAIMETWILLNDSTMVGESILIKSTYGTEPLENVRLVCRNNEYFYCPTAHGQNNEKEVKFKITSFTDSSFIAENPEHNFPKRISYIRINSDSVHAFVDGGPSNTSRRSDFHYSRYKK